MCKKVSVVQVFGSDMALNVNVIRFIKNIRTNSFIRE